MGRRGCVQIVGAAEERAARAMALRLSQVLEAEADTAVSAGGDGGDTPRP